MKSNKEQRIKEGKKKTVKKDFSSNSSRWKYYMLLLVVCGISFVAYLPVLHNGFVNWDDYNYVKDNPLIRSINLSNIFSQFYYGNYHPLTILTYGFEYHLFGIKETGYHAVNLLIHIANVYLVFYAILYLTDKIEIAFVASLLFGIHPLHVETVAWASELKDLLYTFFFLLSFIVYLKYLKHPSGKLYILALLLFLLSLLSKAMAASLPVVLLLTDYFFRTDKEGKTGSINRKVILEKIPFFLLSIVFGIIAIKAQQSSESIGDLTYFTFPQRIIFASYGFISYLMKLLLPFNLSAYYPYPLKEGNGLPLEYYIYALVFVVLIVLIVYSVRFSKKIIYAFGFFAATVFLVLQLLPVGDAIMADRYSYIPSIGIFYLAGEGFCRLWNTKYRMPVLVLLSACTIVYSATTYARCGIWENGLSLWNDVISKNQNIPIAYNNRGFLLTDAHKFDAALLDLNRAILLKPNYSTAYYNRGVLFFMQRKYEAALNDFNRSIELKKNFVDVYFSRAIVYRTINKPDEAINDFNQALTLKPNDAQIYYNRGMVFQFQQKLDEALNDFNQALTFKPDYVEARRSRDAILAARRK